MPLFKPKSTGAPFVPDAEIYEPDPAVRMIELGPKRYQVGKTTTDPSAVLPFVAGSDESPAELYVAFNMNQFSDTNMITIQTRPSIPSPTTSS
jgi:hypothetical protein